MAVGGRPRHGLARVLSKRGICSRTVAAEWILAGRVRVNGRLVRNPESPTDADAAVQIDHLAPAVASPAAVERRVLMLNKPRGLVTTRLDERGRATVYRCLDHPDLPWLAPVGRLDQASEGLLLFSNDPQFGAHLTAPGSEIVKRYHVQIDRLADPVMLQALREGVIDGGEVLRARSVELLRSGQRNCWLEFALTEGRNRQLRRMLQSLDAGVLRLIRVAIGPLLLGELPKGQWRWLESAEIAVLSG